MKIIKHDIMCHDVATLKNCKTIAPSCQAKPRCYENPRIRYFDQISARPNRAPYPRIRSCNSVKRLNFSSNSHIWMEHMQKITNINHVKFDIHTLDNMEVTRTFMFNLHIQTVVRWIILGSLFFILFCCPSPHIGFPCNLKPGLAVFKPCISPAGPPKLLILHVGPNKTRIRRHISLICITREPSISHEPNKI